MTSVWTYVVWLEYPIGQLALVAALVFIVWSLAASRRRVEK